MSNHDYFTSLKFQSTLPRGSDIYGTLRGIFIIYFNPRSLAGATIADTCRFRFVKISIHAPSRERLARSPRLRSSILFQSTLPRGSDVIFSIFSKLLQQISIHAPSRERLHTSFALRLIASVISIHAPSRERQHQNKLLLYSFKSSIFCELAQLKYSKIYFDVRKLIVSHSSLSCEPKLNFMFHITSHHEPKLHKR